MLFNAPEGGVQTVAQGGLHRRRSGGGGEDGQAKAKGNAGERPIPVTTQVVQSGAWSDTLQGCPGPL